MNVELLLILYVLVNKSFNFESEIIYGIPSVKAHIFLSVVIQVQKEPNRRDHFMINVTADFVLLNCISMKLLKVVSIHFRTHLALK
jgi:hypothetical protein